MTILAHRTMLKKACWAAGAMKYSRRMMGSVADWRSAQAAIRFDFDDIKDAWKVSGIEPLNKSKLSNPAIPIIIMTAYASCGNSALNALKKGAYDYLTKPIDFDELKIAIHRATEHNRLKKKMII